MGIFLRVDVPQDKILDPILFLQRLVLNTSRLFKVGPIHINLFRVRFETPFVNLLIWIKREKDHFFY